MENQAILCRKCNVEFCPEMRLCRESFDTRQPSCWEPHICCLPQSCVDYILLWHLNPGCRCTNINNRRHLLYYKALQSLEQQWDSHQLFIMFYIYLIYNSYEISNTWTYIYIYIYIINIYIYSSLTANKSLFSLSCYTNYNGGITSNISMSLTLMCIVYWY